jgi:hypothetical protein
MPREPFHVEHVERMVLAPGTTSGERSRVQHIVRLAADFAREPEACDWMLSDPKLTWHKRAQKLLGETAEKAASLNLTPERVDHEISVVLAMQALEALVKKGRRR